jgi:predicted amidohydrolase
MQTIRVALIQCRSPAVQQAAIDQVTPLIKKSHEDGAKWVFLPEACNLMEQRTLQKQALVKSMTEDCFVIAMRKLAKSLSINLGLGSVIVQSDQAGLSANRSLMINHYGEIIASYDKIHLFDVDTPDGKSYRESQTIKPGDRATIAEIDTIKLGLSICYDVRFAALYRYLAQNDAHIMMVPAAFTVPTGKGHWEVLLRARAIETGAFVLAAAQGGLHEDGRVTYGHSMIVNPWGEVIARLDHDEPGVLVADLQLDEVMKARHLIPQLKHDRPISL